MPASRKDLEHQNRNRMFFSAAMIDAISLARNGKRRLASSTINEGHFALQLNVAAMRGDDHDAKKKVERRMLAIGSSIQHEA
jgi:hypothetical protein